MTDLKELYPRLEATGERSVTVYDRDRAEKDARVIGTVNGGPHGVEAHRPHYSLADRHAARVDGSGDFATIGDGVIALVAAYEAHGPDSWEVG